MEAKKIYVHNGFTLVELLIVIVVIGVLSAMMMFTSTEMMASAKATKIISDLTQLKKAVTAWYLDNYDRIKLSNNGFKVDGNKEIHEVLSGKSSEITKYFTNGFALNTGAKNYNKDFYCAVNGFGVYMGKNNQICFVVYRISGDDNKKDQTSLRAKLKGRAKSTGLLSYNQGQEPYTYDGGNFVFMEVFRLKDPKRK